MELYTAIRSRTSVRRYRPQPVEDEKLGRVLEAARLAPSARNAQEWRFIVVRDPQTRRRLMEAAYDQAFVGEAPVVIAACGLDEGRQMTCGQPACPVDVALAVDHLTLAAVAEGLGSCWVCRFDEAPARAALGIPEGDPLRVIALVPLGYAAEAPPAQKDRLPREAIVRWERWT